MLTGLNNSLTAPGAVNMLGSPVDLGKITADAYVIGGIADHICPWQATYRSAQLLGSKDTTYVLSSSGHIAALVNPPGNPKASFRTGPVDDRTAQNWSAETELAKDLWWPHYVEWLASRSGSEVEAPSALGGKRFPPLGPAPGTYVLEK